MFVAMPQGAGLLALCLAFECPLIPEEVTKPAIGARCLDSFPLFPAFTLRRNKLGELRATVVITDVADQVIPGLQAHQILLG
jgi:hypothetical protein